MHVASEQLYGDPKSPKNGSTCMSKRANMMGEQSDGSHCVIGSDRPIYFTGLGLSNDPNHRAKENEDANGYINKRLGKKVKRNPGRKNLISVFCRI